jgi:hypothetical protein
LGVTSVQVQPATFVSSNQLTNALDTAKAAIQQQVNNAACIFVIVNERWLLDPTELLITLYISAPNA